MNKPQKRCFVDCTHTFNSGLNTGIQRVVRNIVARVEGLQDFRGYEFVPVITYSNELYKIDGNFSKKYRVTRNVNKLLSGIRNFLDVVFFREKKKVLSHFTNEKEMAQFTPYGNLVRLHWYIVSSCQKIIPQLLKRAMSLDRLLLGDSRLTMRKGDIFFYPDSFWWNTSVLCTLKMAKYRRVFVIFLIHDIIPVTHPAYVDESNCKKFKAMLPEVLKLSDGVIANSKYSLDQVVDYCHSNGLVCNFSKDFFHLGADFSSENEEVEPPDSLVKDLGNEKFFIIVGTIEPRKNHIYVLEAFEQLWSEGADFKLCIVGKIGWKCDDILEKIFASANFNKKLLMYNELNDTGLKYLLKGSCAVIIASIIEGFGLPIVEAMYFKKILLASDIPVFREIGKDYPIYFPLDDSRALADLVQQVATGNLKRDTDTKKWLSWDESIESLIEKVVVMAEGKREPTSAKYIKGKEIF
jgi:alpha-1,2-rhamnosyltransferase